MGDHITKMFESGVDATGSGISTEGGESPESPEETVVEEKDESIVNEDDNDGGDDGDGDGDTSQVNALEAEDRLHTLLEKHGFMDFEELEAELDKGRELSDILGNKDAKRVVEDAETLSKYKKAWAAEELEKKRANETPNEYTSRLEKTVNDLNDKLRAIEESTEKSGVAEKALAQYDKEVNSIIERYGSDLNEDERNMAKLISGINNPTDDIDDISDVRKVRKAATSVVKDFASFVKTLKQRAIDEYASGKSSITPIAKDKGSPASTSVEKKRLVSEKDTAKTGFAKAGKAFRESLRAALEE